MSFPTRREFLKRVAYGSAAASALAMPSRVRAVEPSERVRTAVIGLGGQGTALLNRFRQIDDVEIAYVCDPDKSRLAKGRALTDDGAEAVTDRRRILDDKTVDAVIIAAPDHWHAAAGILACDAGKHVYVEKPCSHNLRESRWLLNAARRNKVVVQHGTQSRSDTRIAGAIQMLAGRSTRESQRILTSAKGIEYGRRWIHRFGNYGGSDGSEPDSRWPQAVVFRSAQRCR